MAQLEQRSALVKFRRSLRPSLCGLMLVIAGAGSAAAEPAAETKEAPLAVITLPVRVYLVQSESIEAMQTTLVEEDVQKVFETVNQVWSQARIQFKIESIEPISAKEPPAEPEENKADAKKPEEKDEKKPEEKKSEYDQVTTLLQRGQASPKVIDVFYVKEIKPNGFYSRGGDLIVVKDTAKLREVPDGLSTPLPRVTSHEIGHALGLRHRQDKTNLMQSGTTGYSLNDEEVAIAREKAQLRLAGKTLEELFSAKSQADTPAVTPASK